MLWIKEDMKNCLSDLWVYELFLGKLMEEHENVEDICMCMSVADGFQPKTSSFYTCHLIWVDYKVIGQLSQLIFLLFSNFKSARHNLVNELCLAQKIVFFCPQLFNKLTYSFVPIELLPFKMQNFTFNTQESFRYLGLNIYIYNPYVKSIVCLYKKSLAKNTFCI